VRERGVGAADLFGNIREALRESLDVHLVDDRLVQRPPQRLLVAPVEPWINDHRSRDVRRAVLFVDRLAVGADGVRQHRLTPVDVAVDRAGVRIEEQLRGVAALPVAGRPRPVHAVSVTLTGTDAGHVAVPAERGVLREPDVVLLADLVEQTKVDALGDLGVDRKAGAFSIPMRAERKRLPGPDIEFHIITLERVVQ
jgi:hypothetical protein